MSNLYKGKYRFASNYYSTLFQSKDPDFSILDLYDQPWRFYHDRSHVEHMLNVARTFADGLNANDSRNLTNAILYHDAIWVPGSPTNEDESVALFRDFLPDMPDQEIVAGLIMATKLPFQPKTDLERLMLYIDWSHFASKDPARLHAINVAIFKEFQKAPYDLYIEKRDEFLKFAMGVPKKMLDSRGFVSSSMVNNLLAGIQVSAQLSTAFRPRIGIYLASFNPMHLGHLHVIHKAEQVLDKVIIVQAKNADKAGNKPYELPKYHKDFYQTYEAGPQESAKSIVEKLAVGEADYFIIRGIRNDFDLMAEQNFMRYLDDMGALLPTLHFLCDADYQHMSSSAVRALEAVGVNLYKV